MDILHEGRTLASVELSADFEVNLSRAVELFEPIMRAWPDDDLGPNPRMLCAARVLSAVLRGCDASKQSAWRFTRDPLLEDRLATRFLRGDGFRVIWAMNEERRRRL